MNVSAPRDYSLIAPYYDKFFHRPLSQGHNQIGHLLKKSHRLNKATKVLEVGVGSGLSLSFLPRTMEYVGVDISEEMISRARDKVKALKKINATLELMDATKLKFKSNSFDLVVASSVLSAMDEPMAGFREMIRVTKKGGRIAIVTNLRDADSFKSSLVRKFDPFTRRYLGFRLDLSLEDFSGFSNVKLLEEKQVNSLMGLPLSTYLLFQKK